MANRESIWDLLSGCVQLLDEPFRASEIVGWFRRHRPEINEGSLRAHIQSATSNVPAAGKISGMAGRDPLITRLSHGVYVRYAGGTAPQESSSLVHSTTEPPAIGGAVILVGCSSSKGPVSAPARELFTGQRFRKARAYAQDSQQHWYVLSAKWGLLEPDVVIAPYDVYLAEQPPPYRRAWGEWVTAKLEMVEGDLAGRVIEVHAGRAYVDPMRVPLARLGAQIREPLKGLRQGEQLAWYGGGAPPATLAAVASPTVVASTTPAKIGGFDYRWPDTTETFDSGWEVTLAPGGRSRRIRHGLGGREVYGRHRRHSVTFVDGQPLVEGVAADDYEESRGLLSPLKDAHGRLIRRPEDVPGPYVGLPMVDHRQEIDAAYSRDAVAVKLAEDDVLGWAAYALARAEVRGSFAASASTGTGHLPENAVLPVGSRAGTRTDVVAALLAYGRSRASEGIEGQPSFTPLPEANQLVLDDPFAFLLGVIFDQGIPAERAWRAPYDLRERLGHLDALRLAQEEERVREAIGTVPKLHRYIDKMPGWVVAAARKVVNDYGGDAGSIWSGTPTAAEVFRRLDAFPGIGQKKAAMAVEMLERNFGVPIADMHDSDIAYDVHVRRVFLRTGLAQRDDLDHMVEVARQAHPDRPGEIDLPAWLVGRQWCHAGIPDCPACELRHVCPKDVAAAANVRGA